MFTLVDTPKMMNSVNALMLAYRRVTKENISEHLGISVGAAHKIVNDEHAFSEISCHCVLKILTSERRGKSSCPIQLGYE